MDFIVDGDTDQASGHCDCLLAQTCIRANLVEDGKITNPEDEITVGGRSDIFQALLVLSCINTSYVVEPK